MAIRTTQEAVEVAVQRDFTTNVRTTQEAVEVAVQRDFTTNARVTQMAIEVAVGPALPVGDTGIYFATFI